LLHNTELATNYILENVDKVEIYYNYVSGLVNRTALKVLCDNMPSKDSVHEAVRHLRTIKTNQN